MSEENKQPIKITQRIVGWKVKQEDEAIEERLTREEWESRYPNTQVTLPTIKETVKREAILEGRTYKVKLPKETHSLYITINHQVIDGKPHLFEIFINCKNIDSHQWIAALTRVISAVFRTSNDPSFLIEELSSVFCATTGHFTKWPKTTKVPKGKFLPSLVAEVGEVIRLHLDWIKEREISAIDLGKGDDRTAIQIIDIPLEKVVSTVLDAIVENVIDNDEPVYPTYASICPECKVKAVILKDNCPSCLNCDYSRC